MSKLLYSYGIYIYMVLSLDVSDGVFRLQQLGQILKKGNIMICNFTSVVISMYQQSRNLLVVSYKYHIGNDVTDMGQKELVS